LWFHSQPPRFLGALNEPLQSGSSPTVARLMGISDGPAGATQTLTQMRQLVQDAVRDPTQRVRELALKIIPSSAWVAQIRAIQQWVQNNIRYVQDPPDMELVQTPQKTIEYAAGDCDDQSVLTAALLTATGHPSRFLAVGFGGGPLAHVVTQTKITNTGTDADWVAVETIQSRPLGWLPPHITSRYIRKI
jgi:transglutaminase-like putative cysteine protease